MASGGSFPSILNLNVGGIVYTTTLKTITRDPKSLLGRMFSGTMEVVFDSKGNYFIDRDGSLFRHILNFLRTGKLCLPQPFDELEQLSEEADFYEVGGLVEAIQTRRDDVGVITITARHANLFAFGQVKFLEEVFNDGYRNVPGPRKEFGGYDLGCQIQLISKENALDRLYKAGFQLKGCKRGEDAAGEYVFVRKN